MSKFIFHEGLASKTYQTVFERFLFNEERHRRSQTDEVWNTFSLISEKKQQVVAQIHFFISGRIARSPYKAPFGSIEFDEGLAPKALLHFITKVEKRLKEKEVIKIIIKDTPHQYRPQQSALLGVLLLNSGFKTTIEEINSAIVVDQVNWENKISRAERKRLNRCQSEQLEFQHLGIEWITEIYAFLKRCRHERDTTLSMTFEHLKRTIKICKSDFLLFGVLQNGKLIAASITVKINSRIVYDFYHGHAKSADQLSPVVALIDGMYRYCRQNRFELLDLGTSAVDNKINFSLLNFKTQLGGALSMKLTFEKELN